ncbi:Conserved_hypothetical protein [Hexamita inflata]|uniref:BPI-like protein n=1 Tax=Hexamita inflata TaxID=28002 RepID=A0AA86UXD0_9EUKA|nr:Conserved hypothetical protein [Hexamita inflata]
MIPIVLTLLDCEVSPFPRTLYPEDSGLSIFFTQPGMQKFFRNVLNDGSMNITGQKFPDIKTSVNLGVTKIDIMLTDMVVSEFSVEDVGILLQNENILPLVLAGTRFVLRFNWKIQQQSYPYVGDQGAGNVIVQDAGFQAFTTIGCDYEICPNHLLVNIIHAELQIGAIKIILEGGSSWLYQSMLDLIMGVLQQELQKLITQFLSKDMVDLLNDLLNKYSSYQNYKMDNQITKDERFVSPWVIDNGYVYALFSGYVYHVSNYSDEFITNDKLGEVIYNRFNVESEITIAEACFNNVYYIYHKYENAYSSPGQFEVIEAPIIEFDNAAALLKIKLTINNSVVDVEMKGKPIYFRDQKEAGNAVYYFTFEKHNIYSDNQELDLAVLEQQVIDYINKTMERTVYKQLNSFLYEVEQYQYAFDTIGKVLRIIKMPK